MPDPSAQARTIPVEVSADVLIASNDADLLATRVGFTDHERAELRLAVRELATNLIRHGGGGTITITACEPRVTIEASDEGPGMPDVNEAVADGYSTAGSLGYGLGTVNRIMDEVTISSTMGKGTMVRAHRSHREKLPSLPCPLDIGVATMPKPGYSDNGDTYVVITAGTTALVAVIDGVGHGTPAKLAATAARNYIESHAALPLDSLFRGTAIACRGTRGVVMAIGRIDWHSEKLEFASVGNIESRVIDTPSPVSFIIRRGIIGVNAPPPKVAEFDWPVSATLVLHSDGVASHWDDEGLRAVATLPATAAARELLIRYGKQLDDATVLVVKPMA